MDHPVLFMKMMNESVTRAENGHLQLSLPFKARPILPNNKEQAEMRLNSLKRKFERNPVFRKDYIAFMEDIIARPMLKYPAIKETVSHGIYHTMVSITPRSLEKSELYSTVQVGTKVPH